MCRLSMMREVFEAFLTDPIRINEEIYALWLAGHNANDALLIRMRTPIDLPGLDDDRTLQELLWRDTVDQYRLYEGLDHYLMQPSLFRSQLLFQIPPMQQHYMIECYYKLDRKVARWLVGKKLTAKLQKDLDEISDVAQCTLKSCRRQLENLRRVYSAMEDRNFQGIACQSISELFLISESLGSKYACVMFLQHARLEIHPTHAATGFLTWQDLLFIAALLMVHWIPQRKRLPQLSHATSDPTALSLSVSPNPSSFAADSAPGNTSNSLVLIENAATLAMRSPRGDWPSLALLQDKLPPRSVRATMGLDLSPKMANCLRDLKAHLINDGEMLAIYRQRVMRQLATSSIRSEKDLHNLSVKLYLVVHGLLTIGAGLSQPKELKDLLGNLITMVIRVLKDCNIQSSQLSDVFAALIDSLVHLDAWYLTGHETRAFLLASWDRFLSVCRAIVLSIYDRAQDMSVY